MPGGVKELCAPFSRAHGEDPAGMASGAERYVMMELAPPWPRLVWESPHLPAGLGAVLQRAGERRGRGPGGATFLCIAPDDAYTVPGRVRFLCFHRRRGAAAGFVREEFLVPPSHAAAVAQWLLEHRPRARRRPGRAALSPPAQPASRSTPCGPAAATDPPDAADLPAGSDLAEFERFRCAQTAVRDIMVCTHGSVDACCATFGYPLYSLLRRRYALPSGGRLRVWRVSHFGGHRLAPTLIDFPEGRYWGHVNATALDGLVRRAVPVEQLRRFYRGWGGLQTAFEQVAEREAFVREGWAWTDYLKTSRLLEVSGDGNRAVVRLDFGAPDGSASGTYEATVEVSGTVPAVHCHEAGEPWEVKQYAVTRLIKRAARPGRGGR